MFEIIKKSALITKNNLALTLSLVIYLILISLLTTKLALVQNSWLFLAFVVAMFIFAAAFFSGWFLMLKKAIENSCKTYETEEARIIDSLNIRGQFFPGVQGYILPVFVIFVLYYVLFALWIVLNIWIANHFIGRIDFLFDDIKAISQSKEATLNYLMGLPNAKVMIIYGWQMLFCAAIFVFSVLTMFWMPALYFAKDNSKNPFLALWMSLSAIFRKPLGVIGISAFIAFLVVILLSLGAVMGKNELLAFIYMILTIFFSVFITVLIFSYYGKVFAANCDNGPDSVREDENSDSAGEEN